MKKITLYAPSVRNDASYVDAGETIDIGAKPDQIDADRARKLVEVGHAVSETAAKADARESAD
ncbi:MAG TPA: hypothetical protein DEP91_04355 [Sphingomonas bacterium]|jgi:hypothetical protein|uniref:Uncharacterized protein n=1 Tax=Sphingomonas bacterium TaxID=1895847 RepID=A0A3D0WBN2_9SPHN|nr:hypothetical protein [Sphingomonas bacterium]